MGKMMRAKQQRELPRWKELQRGQSLMEFALSVSILILVFSGVIDLGRAFFTRITLESAVSEGAHWMAAYPGCVAYGAAFGDGSNVRHAPPECKGTNSIMQRIRNESSLLLPANVESVTLQLPAGITRADQIVPGITMTMSVTYRMTVLTPVIKALFGDFWILSAQAKEVVRGTERPPTNGKASPYVPGSGVPLNLEQLRAAGDNRCSDGWSALSWEEPAGVTGGYDIFYINAGTGQPPTSGVLSNPVVANVSPSGAGTRHYVAIPANVAYQADVKANIQTGGNVLWGIKSFNMVGPDKSYSDFAYIVTSCPKVQPKLESFVCNPTNPLSTSVTFNWSMPDTYLWSQSVTQDMLIDGYRLYKVDGTLIPTFTGGNAASRTGSLTFTGPTDPNRYETFRLRAYNAGLGDIGLESDPGNDLTIACDP
jgi:hypothetical protein